MLEPVLGDVKGGRHREDRLAVLLGEDAPGREGAPVADALDDIVDRRVGIAGTQEISMQRMAVAFRNGAGRRDQRLAQNLAAEDSLPARIIAATAEAVVVDGFEIQNGQEIVAHGRPGG